MTEIAEFGELVLVVSAALLIAVLSGRLSSALRVPVAAILLVGSAVAADIAPRIGQTVTVHEITRLGVVALIVILFDGGMELGWKPVRASLGPVLGLGLLGTFATAGIVALAAHYLLGLGWVPAAVAGTALSPTDPAVMFSVLGDNAPQGRVNTILAAESGANDPVGIALMIGVLEAVQHPGRSYAWVGVDVAWEMIVGVVVGAAGAWLASRYLTRIVGPRDQLDPITGLAVAGILYGLASVIGGSGFLAVFVAGLLLSDTFSARVEPVQTFTTHLSSVAELTVFVALGLTVSLRSLDIHTVIVDGVVLSAVLILIARPAAVAALLWPANLRRGEKVFIGWLGLRGAVPILLAAFALDQGIQQSAEVYGIVFVAVTLSVTIQGTLIRQAADRTGVVIAPGD